MQGCVTLDVTSAELVSGTQCAQDMLFTMRVIESIIRKGTILESSIFIYLATFFCELSHIYVPPLLCLQAYKSRIIM